MRWFIEIGIIFFAAEVVAGGFDSAAWAALRVEREAEAARLAKVYEECAGAKFAPAENIVVPVENFEDGSVKTSVAAEKARIFVKEGLIWGEGVKVRQMKEDGKTAAQIDAENCVVDRETRSGWAKGGAKAAYRDEVELSGEGVYFSATNEVVMITKDVKLKSKGDELSAAWAVYDRVAGVVQFEGGVKVHHVEKGTPCDLECERAYVFIEGTNDVRKIVALGGVTVVSGERSGACAKAVYTKVDAGGSLTMFGAEGAMARLEVKGERTGILEGRRIRFWFESEQVEVKDSCITLETKGLELPKGVVK